MQTTTADEFLDLACLTHTGNDAVGRRDQAEAILAASPRLMRNDAYVAAAVGDISALREPSTMTPMRLRGAVDHAAGMRCFICAMRASRLALPGIRSRARVSC
jgi:hypothetical protein